MAKQKHNWEPAHSKELVEKVIREYGIEMLFCNKCGRTKVRLYKDDECIDEFFAVVEEDTSCGTKRI